MAQAEIYSAKGAAKGQRKRQRTLKLMRKNWILYLFLLPAIAYIGVFHYGPMYGIQLAFRDFAPSLGIWGSPFVGMKYFDMFFSSPRFSMLLSNTIILSVYNLLLSFPAPILLALILHYTPNLHLKKFAQTVTYAPHFISTVVLVGMLNIFLSPSSGFINSLIKALGMEPIYFFGEAGWFRHVYVLSDIWQNAGWGSIIYMAALTAVSPELHEAAIIDGATKLQRIYHIDVPTIMPTMVILLIMSLSNIMSIGFEKTYLMQTSLNLTTSEVISTYTYKVGLMQAEYSYSTAIGLFNNVINFTLLIVVNWAARRLSGSSLW
ncbi:MAG TPA: sugar ABC transporter permease [Candidatus Faecaligallichristensenella faecipullorum]|nr:sugar ABC transporter permease [Candidatus Faecaligallichristensenella faecipullorum]